MTHDVDALIKNLERHRMAGYFVADRSALLALVASLVPQGSTVGVGGSVTLEQTGVLDLFRRGSYTFYDRYAPGLSSAQKHQLYLQCMDADTYLTGTNAVTMDGKLFNIDGNGNRVAAMVFGPRQVLVVVGRNKIVADLDAAIERTRQVAAPLNTKRLDKGTPCTKLGRCTDCLHENRICYDFVLITGQMTKNRIKVIIVDEDLGY